MPLRASLPHPAGVQNILGITLFMRLTFIVGNMGLLATMLMLCLSVAVTILTALSMSAITTNERAFAGGSCYMVPSPPLLPFVAQRLFSHMYPSHNPCPCPCCAPLASL